MTAPADLGEAGFEALLEAAPDGILVVDEAGQILVANQRAEHLFGYPAGALIGLSVDLLVPDRLRHGHRGRREGYLADPHPRPMGVALALYGRRRDGADFPVEISLSSLRTAAGVRVITIVRDVSERRALEAESEALRQRSLQAVSDAALRNLAPDVLLPAVLGPVSDALSADVVAISICEPGGGALRVRAALGLPPGVIGSELLVGEGVSGRIATGGPAVHRGVGELVELRWRAHVPDTLIGAPLVLGDEVIGVVIAGRTGRPLLGEDDAAQLGRLAERIALAVGQGRLYEAAQAAESRLREILGDVVGVVWEAHDVERRRYSFVSVGAEGLLGYPTQAWTEADGLWSGIIDPADRDDVLARTAQAVAERREHQLEYRVRTADGRTLWVRDHARVGSGDGDGRVRLRGLMVDVTERRDLETTLLHAQKMQAVGQLAGGVAHDFNNMLTAIIGYSGLLAARIHDRDALEDLSEIDRAAKRAQGLTEQLLSFSRRQGPSSELVDLSELVAGLKPMLRRLIDEDIDLALMIGGRSVLVEADPGRLEQVIVNLVINARDAMPGGGTLTVTVRMRDANGAPQAALSVTDTGTGMDEATRQRVFEPFFTTKAAGKGTGLGLSTVYGIIDQAGGTITIDSAPGDGTEITVLLPLSEVAVAPEPRPTVLIVEDEAALRKLVRRVLEADGRRVLEAGDGHEALAVLEREGLSVDLLITDVVMPGMNGPELVAQVSERWPELRVVYSSGYTDGRLTGRGFDASAVDLLGKPYTIEDLRRRVAQELGEPT